MVVHSASASRLPVAGCIVSSRLDADRRTWRRHPRRPPHIAVVYCRDSRALKQLMTSCQSNTKAEPLLSARSATQYTRQLDSVRRRW